MNSSVEPQVLINRGVNMIDFIKRVLVVVLFLMVAMMTMAVSCDPDDPVPVVPESGFEDITVTALTPEGCENHSCYQSFRVSFTDPSDVGSSFWYWAQMELGGIKTKGKPAWLYNDGGILTCSTTVYYFDYPQDQMELVIYRAQDIMGMPDTSKMKSQAVTDPQAIAQLDGACYSKCCSTEEDLRSPYYYVQRYRAASDIVEAKALITTRYGQLCGEPEGTSNAQTHSSAHLSIERYDTNYKKKVWVQTGVGRERDSLGTIFQGWYLEIVGTGGQEFFAKTPNWIPADGEPHTYGVHINTSDGQITYTYDGSTEVFPVLIWCWNGDGGQHVAWGGEIYGHETDMPGTEANKCYFESCQYRLYDDDFGVWRPADFATTYLLNDDSTEFKWVRTGESSFYILDKQPLPAP